LGFLSWYQWGWWFRQGKPISPLYHAVFYTNKITTLGMNQLFCFRQVPLYCVHPMQLSVHYFITIVLVYLSFTSALILLADGFPSLFIYVHTLSKLGNILPTCQVKFGTCLACHMPSWDMDFKLICRLRKSDLHKINFLTSSPQLLCIQKLHYDVL
jgi:hypothetical protein